MVRPQDAAVPLASNTPLMPTPRVVGGNTAAIGLCAAFTALSAFTMPAPHWPGTHEHSWLVGSVAGHTGRPPVFGGNGLALTLIRAISCGGVKFELTARISA